MGGSIWSCYSGSKLKSIPLQTSKLPCRVSCYSKMSRHSLSGRRASYSATSLPAISEDDTVVGNPHPPPYNEFEPRVHQDRSGKLPINFKQEPDRSPGEDERLKPRGCFGRQLAKRGGWIRFLVAFIIIVSLVPLGIGLGVGLSMRKL